MKILITGASGFVGSNLYNELEAIRQNKNNQLINIEEIYCYDSRSDESKLESYCKQADFVFHLAGINRPRKQDEYIKGNVDFFKHVLELLKKYNNMCTVMLASSIQAMQKGRFINSQYGASKKAAEELLLSHMKENKSDGLIFRFPNIFGKGGRPNYNSVIATFCYNIARGLDIHVDDPNTELELVYIDDVVQALIKALLGKVERCEYIDGVCVKKKDGKFCYVSITYHKRLREIVDLLNKFHAQDSTLIIPETQDGSFEKKLFSTYISYLPKEKMCFPLEMHNDFRGSFTEIIKTLNTGQLSVNVSKPGVVKGNHWHMSKWEIFVVVSGHGLIQQRKIGCDVEGKKYPIYNFEVTGERMQAVYMIPGYTHNIDRKSVV